MQNQNFQWDHYAVGVCYYPEHWPQSMWEDDLNRMKNAGISCIRIAEFAWSIFERTEKEFSFSLFDTFLELCLQHDMKVIFGTPTATPPAWLTEKYPEVLNAGCDGTLLRHGGRRHYNYNSQIYRKYCARIVTELARHYGKHPAIVGWQIDNELNCETDEFYSEADHIAFRAFLQNQYQTLEKLNAAWGTVFWSQTYTDWSQIYVPRPVLNGGYNPHFLLDYSRFISESCISFAKLQSDILREYIKPGDFITTNGLFGNLDNHRMQNEVLDVYTFDSYPDFAFELKDGKDRRDDMRDRNWSRLLNETRSVCPHFGIMEQQSGAGGWANRMEMPAPRPGQMTLWAMQSIAHGADYISFFRWRTAAFGTEIYWHGILDYDNRDNRKLAEVKAFSERLRKIDAVCGANHVASFALIKDYDNEWDKRCDSWHRRIAEYSEKEIFAASEQCHSPYDVIYINDETKPEELLPYSVLLYPHPMIMTEKRAALLKTCVEKGATLIVGCRSGLKDIHGRMVMKPQPGLLQELTGTDVQDFSLVHPEEQEDPSVPIFHDILTPLNETKVLKRYTTSYYAGEACLTEKETGKGRTLHLGSAFSRETVRELFEYVGIYEPFGNIVEAPEKVELVMREKDNKKYLFALNYCDTEQSVVLKTPVTVAETGALAAGEQLLPAYGSAVYVLQH